VATSVGQRNRRWCCRDRASAKLTCRCKGSRTWAHAGGGELQGANLSKSKGVSAHISNKNVKAPDLMTIGYEPMSGIDVESAEAGWLVLSYPAGKRGHRENPPTVISGVI
jgi:hypothetical protein